MDFGFVYWSKSIYTSTKTKRSRIWFCNKKSYAKR